MKTDLQLVEDTHAVLDGMRKAVEAHRNITYRIAEAVNQLDATRGALRELYAAMPAEILAERSDLCRRIADLIQ